MKIHKTLAYWAACAFSGSLAVALVHGQAPATAQTGDAGRKTVAMVNGTPVTELALERALERFPENKRAEMRSEILDFLIDNILIDQYLTQIKVEVTNKEIDDKLTAMNAEAKAEGKDFSKILEEVKLTLPELRQHLAADIRWDNFLEKQATPQVLKQMFDNNKDVFEGATVRARHILLPVDEGKTPEAVKTQILSIRSEIEKSVETGLAKLPPTADKLTREKERTKLIDEAFAKQASLFSTCPSKDQGGDVGFFGREGAMVEPFSKAAFALQPYQMSDPVISRFGCHLIMTLEKKAGREVKLEDVKDEVKEYYAEKLREHLTSHLRKSAKIQVVEAPAAKPAATPAAPPSGNGG